MLKWFLWAELLNNIYYLSRLEGSLCYTYYTFLAVRWYLMIYCSTGRFQLKHFFWKIIVKTRMHSSRMHTACFGDYYDKIKKLRHEDLDLHRLLALVHNSCCYATMQHLMTSFCNIWWHHFATFDDIILYLMTSFWMTCTFWILNKQVKNSFLKLCIIFTQI